MFDKLREVLTHDRSKPPEYQQVFNNVIGYDDIKLLLYNMIASNYIVRSVVYKLNMTVKYVIIGAIMMTLIGASLNVNLVNASVVDNEDMPKEQEECEKESDYDYLCSGSDGVQGKPFCDKYNATESIKAYPNMTEQGCWDRIRYPITFCEAFDDLTSSYEYCREVPGSEEYFEYMETGGPDESCQFDAYQIKCLPFPNVDRNKEG